jgi:hypothetical protein
LHVFTRLHGRSYFTQDDIALQRQTFHEITGWVQ